MKVLNLLLLALVVTTSLSSCKKIKGTGELVTENRTLTGYTGIEMSMDGTLNVTPGPDYSLKIEAQENLMPYIEVYASGGYMIVRQKPNITFSDHLPITITATAPVVSGVFVSGSGVINVLGNWAGSSLETGISGSGNISIQSLDAGFMKAGISGSGNIKAESGYVSIDELFISGSGNIDFRSVVADSCSATISGSGNIYTQVIKQLDATIAGSGNIYYLGQPAINVSISGSGKVIKM